MQYDGLLVGRRHAGHSLSLTSRVACSFVPSTSAGDGIDVMFSESDGMAIRCVAGSLFGRGYDTGELAKGDELSAT